MHRWTKIVLAKPAAPLPPNAQERPQPARHWGRWRNGGAVLSVLLHGAVLTLLTLSVPVLGGPAMPEKQPEAIPVEVVQRPPEPKPEEKKEEEKQEAKKEEEKKPESPARKTPPPNLELPKPDLPKPDLTPELAKPAPPKTEAQPPQPAAKTAPPPAPRAAAPPKAAPQPPAGFPPALAEPPPSEPAPPPSPSFLPEAKLPAAPPPAPAAPPPQPGLKVDADDDSAPPPNAGKNELGYWVLEPVTVNLGHKCGLARLSGVLELKEKVAEGIYRGTMRTRIAWANCPAEGVLRQVELRIRGVEVEMVGTGFVDRGVIGQKTMLLEDSFGRSVWKKR